MVTQEPRVFLHFEQFGQWYDVPFPRFHLRDDQAFYDFCMDNLQSGLHFEREASGEVRLMPPSGSDTGRVNGYILTRLSIWNENNGEPGVVFDSSTGFRLPYGAIRAPDVAYVVRARYDALTDFEREHHAPLAPDFVIEVMSPSDRYTDLHGKMMEYIANGVRLGWLIDRKGHTITVYRPNNTEQKLTDLESISADPELPGFVLFLERVF